MYSVVEKSIKVYEYLLSHFNGTINEDMRKKLTSRLEKSKEILKKRSL